MKYVLAILCIIFDCAYIELNKRNKNIIGMVAKVLAASCFICIGFLGYKSSKNTFAYMILIGLILDGIGDLFLAIRNFYAKDTTFLLGTIFFLFGHILYISALVLLNNNYLLLCIAIGIVLGLTIFLIYKKLCSFSRVLNYVGIVYCIMLVTMLTLSIGTYFTYPEFKNFVFMFGAALFVSSDCILILYNFGEKKSWMHPVYSFLYFAGQILISLSLHL